MASPALIFSDPYETEDALRRFGLPSASVFETAVRQGDVQRRQVTANDVKSAGGFNAWARATRVLRDMSSSEWEPVHYPIPAIQSDSKMIIVVAGDARTGLAGADPKTKNERRVAWRSLLGLSSSTPQLFAGFDAAPAATDREVWVLMTFPTPTGVRAEISRPVGVDVVEHRLVEWEFRVLFGELRPDDGKKIGRPYADTPGGDTAFPHDIVRRRSA